MKLKSLNYNKGKFGEELAKNWLKNQGYVLIESNFKINIGEIDLVMSDSDWLVFVEVKYKFDEKKGYPEEMLDKRKLAQVKKVAELYILNNRDLLKCFKKYRIDAVCILGQRIKHYKNIYV